MSSGPRHSTSSAGFIGSGAIAGGLSAFAFTVIHQVLISPIWFALPAMLVAGAICGSCLAWSYTLVVRAFTVRSWLVYTSFYLAMFVALGLISLAAFEPVTTIATLLQSQEPPRELIGRALPVSAAGSMATAALLSAVYRPGWRAAGVLLVSTSVLVLLLGLNISILGLVAVPRSALGVLGEVVTLLVVLSGVYACAVVILNRSRFVGAGGT